MRGAYIAGDRLGRKHAYVSSFSLHVLANRKLFVRSLSLWGRLQIRMPRWGGCRCVLNIVCLLCMLHACHLRLACALNYCHSMYHLVISVYVRLYLLYRSLSTISVRMHKAWKDCRNGLAIGSHRAEFCVFWSELAVWYECFCRSRATRYRVLILPINHSASSDDCRRFERSHLFSLL